jgi:sterol desaturase/sphingolipid hydroxylase (fatty acid hydroxylase superfamily)
LGEWRNYILDFILSHENYFVLSWLLVLFSLEQFKKNFSISTKVYDRGLERWLKNSVFGILNKLLSPILLLPIILLATGIHLWERPTSMSKMIALVIDVIILDLASYCFHQLSHRIPFLWRFHEVHHLDSAFDATTGLRIHFGELLLQNIFRIIPIVAFAIPLKSVLIFEVIMIAEGLFHHSNICISEKLEKILSYVIITPNRHSVHHHALIKDTNSNYGFIFVWWDKIFGSFNSAKRESTWHIGLEYAPDLQCTALLMSPFIFKKLKNRMEMKGYKILKNVS